MVALKRKHGAFADALVGAINAQAGCSRTLPSTGKRLRLPGFDASVSLQLMREAHRDLLSRRQVAARRRPLLARDAAADRIDLQSGLLRDFHRRTQRLAQERRHHHSAVHIQNHGALAAACSAGLAAAAEAAACAISVPGERWASHWRTRGWRSTGSGLRPTSSRRHLPADLSAALRCWWRPRRPSAAERPAGRTIHRSSPHPSPRPAGSAAAGS